jgi:hypothetical protein
MSQEIKKSPGRRGPVEPRDGRRGRLMLRGQAMERRWQERINDEASDRKA